MNTKADVVFLLQESTRSVYSELYTRAEKAISQWARALQLTEPLI